MAWDTAINLDAHRSIPFTEHIDESNVQVVSVRDMSLTSSSPAVYPRLQVSIRTYMNYGVRSL